MILLVVWLACGIAAMLLAEGRGSTDRRTWFLVGALLGPLGVATALVGDPQRTTGVHLLGSAYVSRNGFIAFLAVAVAVVLIAAASIRT